MTPIQSRLIDDYSYLVHTSERIYPHDMAHRYACAVRNGCIFRNCDCLLIGWAYAGAQPCPINISQFHINGITTPFVAIAIGNFKHNVAVFVIVAVANSQSYPTLCRKGIKA